MVKRDPLDDYAEMLRAEASSNDEMLDAGLQHQGVPEHLEQAALRYDASRQRYEGDARRGDASVAARSFPGVARKLELYRFLRGADTRTTHCTGSPG